MEPKKDRCVELVYCPDALAVSTPIFPPYAMSVFRTGLAREGYAVETVDLSLTILREPALLETHRRLCSQRQAVALDDFQSPAAEAVLDGLRGNPAVQTLLNTLTEEVGRSPAPLICFGTLQAPLLYALLLADQTGTRLGRRVAVGGRAVWDVEADPLRAFSLFPNIDVFLLETRLDFLCRLTDWAYGDPLDSAQMPRLIFRDAQGSGVTDASDGNQAATVPPWQHDTPSYDPHSLAAYAYDRERIRLLVRRDLDWDALPEASPPPLAVAEQFYNGCNLHCAFCPRSSGGMSEVEDPVAMAQRLADLHDRYGIRYFFLLNAHINPSPNYAERFCDELLRLGRPLYWSDSASFSRIRPELLLKMKAAGCLLLWWGCEMISDRLLAYVGKRLTEAEIEQGLTWSHEAGLFNCVNLIVGMPYEMPEDAARTRDFLLRYADRVDGAVLNKFELRFGSLLARHPEQYAIRLRPELGADAFDELDGLAWPEKVAQTERHYEDLLSIICPSANRFSSNAMLIFYLHAASGGTKREIKQIVRRLTGAQPGSVPY